jgi:hypothetical protein
VSDNTIVWTPTPFAISVLTSQASTPAAQGRLLARFTLKGSTIWATNKPDLLLDGEVFADPRVPTGFRLPSGNQQRGGDLEVWFFIQPPAGFSFTASAPTPPPQLRADGLTELVADVTLTGIGGTAGKSDTVNITAILNTGVANTPSNPPSLFIDNATAPIIGTVAAAAASSITFTNVTFTEPGPTGAARVLRITGIRVNAAALGPGALVQVAISISGPVAIGVNNPQQTVGTVGPRTPVVGGPVPGLNT